MSLDCDLWRENYDTTTFEQQKAVYDEIAVDSPEQVCWNLAAVKPALAQLAAGAVTEIGGWRGEMAAAVLPENPQIVRWTNYEVCRFVVEEGSRCHDPRYEPIELHAWPWETDLKPAEMFMASHVIEHMRWKQLVQLARQFHKFEVLHLQIPLPLHGATNWRGYDGTHILEVGWGHVHVLVVTQGFRLVHQDTTKTCRTYAR